METEYFDIVAGVLKGDTLAPYLFIICLEYVLRTSIDFCYELFYLGEGIWVKRNCGNDFFYISQDLLYLTL